MPREDDRGPGLASARGQPPADLAAAQQRMRAATIPQAVVHACRVLAEGGHAAVLVGGAVRDALLNKAVSDWDVATSATPDEVMASFPRTIPTGIDHGTVTALVAEAGGEAEPIEITTFRGEGAYADGRRPDRVEFHRSLVDDLARRDLTVNALAWDPVAQELSDPFDGLGDLRLGVIRAVGDPTLRFREDGLRTMRAVRFCATLAMTLQAETAAAIPDALDVLDKVSRERVHVELTKMLAAPAPSLGLLPMASTGIWPHVIPVLPDEARAAALRAVDRMAPDPVVRLARLLRPVARAEDGARRIEAAVLALRPSKVERTTIAALTGPRTDALQHAGSAPDIRRAAAALTRPLLDAALEVLGADEPRRAEVRAACDGAALTGKELRVRGGDLIAAKIANPGPALGDLMDALLEWVLEDPARNDAAMLLAHARTLRDADGAG
ncbi:MAG: tRNA cytidylyltransferase [Myxococcota bacterium]